MNFLLKWKASDKNQTEKKKKDTKDDEEVEVIEEDDDERDIIYQKNQCSKTNLVDFFPKNFDLSQYYSDLSGII